MDIRELGGSYAYRGIVFVKGVCVLSEGGDVSEERGPELWLDLDKVVLHLSLQEKGRWL